MPILDLECRVGIEVKYLLLQCWSFGQRNEAHGEASAWRSAIGRRHDKQEQGHVLSDRVAEEIYRTSCLETFLTLNRWAGKNALLACCRVVYGTWLFADSAT